MPVFSLSQHRERREKSAAADLPSALETELPSDMYMEEGTEIVLLTEADWAKLNALFRAFGLTVAQDIRADRLIDLWYHLTGELGYHLRLRFRNESLYHDMKRDLAPKTQAYLDAVFTGDLIRAAALAKELDVVGSCPVIDSPCKNLQAEKKADR